MKKIIKKFLFISIVFCAILLLNKVNAATCNVTANKTNIEVGDQVSISVNVNAGSWNIGINGGGLTGSGDTSGLAGQTTTTSSANASKTYTFKANSAGTYTILVTGDITDYDTDVTSTVSKPITITVAEKQQPVQQQNQQQEQPAKQPEQQNQQPANNTQKEPEVTFSNVNQTVYAVDSGINVRATAGTNGGIIGKLNKGQEIQRTGIGSNGWSKINYNGSTAYVSSQFLTTTKPQVEEEKDDEKDKDKQKEEEKKEKSSNKALKDLVVQNYKLTPDFTPENTKYTLEVTKDVNELAITPIPEDSNAETEIQGNENFRIGSNIIKIIVKAEDGTTRMYTITVTKTNQEDDEVQTLKLKSLEVKEGNLSPEFDPNLTSYSVEVDDPNSINVKDFVKAVAEENDVNITIAESKESDNRIITIMLEDSEGKRSGVYQVTLKKKSVIPVGNIKENIMNNSKIYGILGGIIAVLILAIIVVIILLRKTIKEENDNGYGNDDELSDEYDYSLKNAIDRANRDIDDEEDYQEFDDMVENSKLEENDNDDLKINTEYNVFTDIDESSMSDSDTKMFKMSNETPDIKNKKKGKHF